MGPPLTTLTCTAPIGTAPIGTALIGTARSGRFGMRAWLQ